MTDEKLQFYIPPPLAQENMPTSKANLQAMRMAVADVMMVEAGLSRFNQFSDSLRKSTAYLKINGTDTVTVYENIKQNIYGLFYNMNNK
ncbi:hypothetical protein DPMN_042037 [Dreissena polymorpha]|uniref:Uncharacterized protein n=1 Tax=Dreissena polymorpha TaxID=45954 RepID=A0A9D4HWK4_DREPO|nr:hypothetical protein DPMN_042037 [Dreissena polymorpha]